MTLALALALALAQALPLALALALALDSRCTNPRSETHTRTLSKKLSLG
jgi:hypothetical protein